MSVDSPWTFSDVWKSLTSRVHEMAIFEHFLHPTTGLFADAVCHGLVRKDRFAASTRRQLRGQDTAPCHRSKTL